MQLFARIAAASPFKVVRRDEALESSTETREARAGSKEDERGCVVRLDLESWLAPPAEGFDKCCQIF